MTGRLEQHKAADLAALDRLQLGIYVAVVPRRFEAADMAGELVEAPARELTPDRP